MNKEAVIEVEGLYKRFGDFVANDNLSFTVKKGEIFGFLGANGAGKTTAMKILCGLLSPSEGIARVAGFDVYKEAEKIKQHIGYMSQRFSLYEDLSVMENIVFYGGIYGIKHREIQVRAKALLSDLGLWDKRKRVIGSLPLGWKQKIAFSLAMMHRPSIVFLDEPTGGVDPLTRRQFWEMIYQAAEQGYTLFVTTHYMDEAEYCDRVSIMVEGKIVALDTPSALKSQYHATSMEEVFLQLAREEPSSVYSHNTSRI
ncbi:MAG: ABC transporter [Bacteroidetes bacterium]|nr:MAG: ABC transporter [Bacteroidota bacterium]